MLSNILVYGWYHHGNAGDELFKEAFCNLFPELKFTFTDNLEEDLIDQSEAIFIGGGSFLYAPIKITPKGLSLLKSKPLFYIGVGVETDISPINQDLIKKSKLINIRNDNVNIEHLNTNVISTLDIVYSLKEKVIQSPKKNKSILILPNFAVVPSYKDENWKHASWGYFKSEFAQFLDHLINDGYTVDFFPMCHNLENSDSWAAIEIINFMTNKKDVGLLDPVQGIYNLSSLFSQYEAVITQRYHGIVLSEMTNVPYLSLYHHDKLRPVSHNTGRFMSYYGLCKSQLIDNFPVKTDPTLLIERDIFEELRSKTLHFLSSG